MNIQQYDSEEVQDEVKRIQEQYEWIQCAELILE
jgi:hypothetical protein